MAVLKEQKSYKTRQREQILNCLTENSTKHMTADEIVDWLKEHQTDNISARKAKAPAINI